uniref:LITAF domain-containing protein n=1 Tax=Panagrolaimus sp. JU765 TaxID=591449 RepID=A0AC34QZH0_9BILA
MSNSPPPPYSETDSQYPVKGTTPYPETDTLPQPLQANNLGVPPPSSMSADINHTRVIQLPPIVIQTPLFGAFPVETDCRYCNAHIVTHTQKVAGALPWIIMGICFVLGFFLLIPWCICCIPFCIDSCLDVLHTCPSCKRALGRFSRI